MRIIAAPNPREFDEYDVRRFEVGQVYEVSSRLATLLVLAGFAEPVNAAGDVAPAQAADAPSRSDKTKT